MVLDTESLQFWFFGSSFLCGVEACKGYEVVVAVRLSLSLSLCFEWKELCV